MKPPKAKAVAPGEARGRVLWTIGRWVEVEASQPGSGTGTSKGVGPAGYKCSLASVGAGSPSQPKMASTRCWLQVEMAIEKYGKGRDAATALRALLRHVHGSGFRPDTFRLMADPTQGLQAEIVALGLRSIDLPGLALEKFYRVLEGVIRENPEPPVYKGSG